MYKQEINELLDSAKEKLGVESDYELAKALEVWESEVHFWRKGIKAPDSYACFKLAEATGESPLVLIVKVQANLARTMRKRLYFQRFFSILALWITLGLPLGGYNGTTSSAYAGGVTEKSDNNQHNATLCEV